MLRRTISGYFLNKDNFFRFPNGNISHRHRNTDNLSSFYLIKRMKNGKTMLVNLPHTRSDARLSLGTVLSEANMDNPVEISYAPETIKNTHSQRTWLLKSRRFEIRMHISKLVSSIAYRAAPPKFSTSQGFVPTGTFQLPSQL